MAWAGSRGFGRGSLGRVSLNIYTQEKGCSGRGEIEVEDGEGYLPAGRRGFEFTIWVSRREAKTELRGGGPPLRGAFLKPDMAVGKHSHRQLGEV